MKSIYLLYGAIVLNASFASMLFGKEILLMDHAGEPAHLSVNSSDQFEHVIEDVSLYYKSADTGSHSPLCLNLTITDDQMVVKQQNSGRNYHAKVTAHEKKDIEFLVTRMAWDNPKKLWDYEDDMNKAGDRIMHLHPLKFLETICIHEKLCAGLKAIRERNILVWPNFSKGSVKTLKEEHKLNNVIPHIEEFASTIGVNVKLLMPLAKKERWDDFVKSVADHVQRSNDPNRYDM